MMNGRIKEKEIMKYNSIISIISCLLFLLPSCSKDFLQKLPQGQLSEPQVGNSKGVEGALLGAYSIMNGNINGSWGNYSSAPSQWVFGELASDNAHKGSEQSDQPNMNMIENYTAISTNDNLSTMWQVYYEGVLRCNITLNLLETDRNEGKEVTEERALEIEAETKMLRAHYYFFLWRVFRNIPYVDENTPIDEAKEKPNDSDVLPRIEEDLKFAVDKLPEDKIMDQAGR